jgi:hypothetical protein
MNIAGHLQNAGIAIGLPWIEPEDAAVDLIEQAAQALAGRPRPTGSRAGTSRRRPVLIALTRPGERQRRAASMSATVIDSAVEALAAQNADLDLHHVAYARLLDAVLR